MGLGCPPEPTAVTERQSALDCRRSEKRNPAASAALIAFSLLFASALWRGVQGSIIPRGDETCSTLEDGPENALALCVDEKPSIHALDDTQASGANSGATDSLRAGSKAVFSLPRAREYPNDPDRYGEGKTVIDATNAFGVLFEELDGLPSSAFVAKAFTGAKLVKAFNHLVAATLATDPIVEGGHRVVFLSSDDEDAIAPVADLAKKLGFAPVKLGKLNEGGALVHARGRTWVDSSSRTCSRRSSNQSTTV